MTTWKTSAQISRLVIILNEIPLKRMRYDVVAKGYCCIICFHAESITLQRSAMIFDFIFGIIVTYLAWD
uniref:Uncharacterized protein n=1 Tax=Gossypium raimondii TaxID=29730 RepID=A0A0D2S2G4_GOSRA|nr:hypothetical protein B456_006G131000 [Gossypium raimondii]